MESYHRIFYPSSHKANYLSLLFLATALRTFVFSFLGLFLPILLFNQLREELGYQENQAILFVGIVFFVLPLTHSLLTFIVVKINAKLGTRAGLIIGQLFFLFFLIIISLTKEISFFILGFILWGFSTSFWWVSYHSLFLELSERKKFSKEIGTKEIFSFIAGLIAPIFAGVLLSYYNRTILFFISVIIIGLSMVFLLLEHDSEKLNPVSIKDIGFEMKKRTRDFLAFIGAGGVEIIYSLAWPIFLYTILKNYLKIGGFSSLVLGMAAFFTYVVSNLIDKFDRNKLKKLGTVIIASTWLGRFFFQSPLVIFICDAIYRTFFSSFFYLPLTALAYSHALHDNKIKYVVFREIAYKIGNLLGLIFFVAFIFFNISFQFIFLFGAMFALMAALIKEK